MSVNSRGQFSGPGSVPRDYGLLQAPSKALKHFHGFDGDVSHADEEHAELDEARQAIQRYAQSGSVFDPHFAPAAASSEAERPHGRTGRAPERHAARAPSHDRRSRSQAPSVVASSRESSVEPHGRGFGDHERAVAMPSGRASHDGPQTGSFRRSSYLAASHSPGGSSIARRYREMVLGGEPNPPPIEQFQQQYLQQHYPSGQLPSDASATGAPQRPGMVRRRSSLARHSGLSAQRPERRWSRASNDVVPRAADVAQVKQQLKRRSSVASSIAPSIGPADIERLGGQAHERTPLVSQGNSTSYAGAGSSSPASPDGADQQPKSGTSGPTATSDTDSVASTEEFGPKAIPGPGAATEEAKTLGWYTVPILGTHLLELSLSVVVVFAIGHLGTTELAAASLASMTANVTGFSIISGWVSALDSLLPAAYSSPHPYTVGIWTQRMVIMIALLIVPIVMTWFNTERILLALHQDPGVSAMAARYLRVLTLALPAFGGFEIIRRYLQALGLFHAPTIAVGVASAFNVPAQILLVYGPDKIRLGFMGAPVASVLSYYLMLGFGLMQCYVAPRDAWQGLTRKALEVKGLIEVWNLGLSSTIALAAEWWAWEVANLMASALGTSALAAQSVLLVTCSMTYQLPMSVSVASAVRIGNLLGADQPHWAELSTRTAMWGALICGLLNSSVMILFRNQWGWMFSSDPELVTMIATILPYVGAFQIADGICGVAAGILRGSGRQSKGAVINVFAYYVIGIPIGGALMFSSHSNWGLQGIWLGLFIGLMVGATGFLVLIFRTDWSVEAENVLSRMAEDVVSDEEEEECEEEALEEEIRSLQNQ